MGNSYLDNAGTFLINFFFGFFLLIVMVRMLLGMVRGDFRNPVVQFLVKVSNPVLVPLRRVIPPIGGVDTAAVLILIVLQCLELFLIGALRGVSFSPAGLLILSAVELLDLLLKIYLYGILIQVILSWVNPSGYNPVAAILYQINEPLLGPARRAIPPISGFDLSPMVVMLVLQLISMLVLAPLSDFARGQL